MRLLLILAMLLLGACTVDVTIDDGELIETPDADVDAGALPDAVIFTDGALLVPDASP